MDEETNYKILDGKRLAEPIIAELKEEIQNKNIKTKLTVLIVGNNPASEIYVGIKERECKKTGIDFDLIKFPEDIEQKEVLSVIEKLNLDSEVTGILVQLPLPEHIDENIVINSVDSLKDVDGFTPFNLGRLVIDDEIIIPATAKACIEFIRSTGINISGKHAVVVGRSKIVGKPVVHALLKENATVTVCHTKTLNLAEHTKNADIIIAAAGSPSLIKADMIKEGAIVIDVGITKTSDGLKGDVDFEEAKKVAGYITPVPGGVGPMTIAMLLKNVIILYGIQEKGKGK